MRSFTFLVNPLSGGGAAPEAVVPVARLLRDAGATVEVTYSPGIKAAQDLVSAGIDRGDVIVAVGGDGMLSSMAGQVSRLGGILGMVPAGRGNDFARMLEMSAEPSDVATMLLDGAETSVYLLSATLPGAEPRLVAGSVYSGVDARAAAIADQVRWMPDRLQYPYAALRAFATYVPSTFEIVVDGQRHSFVAATVVVANSGYYGKGMHVAPNASVTDGLADVVVIEAASRRAMMKALPKVYDGQHIELEQVTVLRGTRIELSATPSVPMGGDGEPLGTLPTSSATPAVIEVLPAALRVLV